MSKRNLKALWSWASAGLGLLALMVQFQNCSPSGAGSQALSTDETDQVKIVDDWAEKALVFPESLIQLHDQTQDFVAHGLCPRKLEGELTWVLFDETQSIVTGKTSCEMGGFQVELSELNQLKCGTSFLLQVFNEDGLEAKTLISRKCAPLLAQESFLNKAQDEVCYLELDRSPYAIEPQCYQACYVEERLAFRESVERNRCGAQVGG